MSLIKQNFISLLSLIFVLSLFFKEVLSLNSEVYRISITEILFLILIFFIFIKYKTKFIFFFLRFENYTFFDFLIFFILILKIIKFSFNFSNYFNLYELLIWFYMICIYQSHKFLLINDKRSLKIIEYSFILLTLLISIHVIASLFIYLANIKVFDLWIYRESTYLPYMGTSTLHFKSLFENYNLPAHLIIPGVFFLLLRNKEMFKKNLLVLFFLIVFYLIKSKVLILVFGCLLCLYFIQKFKHNIFLLKKIYILFLLCITIFYFSITHFILIKSEIINSTNFEFFNEYFFTEFSINFYNYEIYGSLFLKLKYVTLLIAKSFNYLLFDQINYYQSDIVLDFFNQYADPHSEYFGALANYGILGFFSFLIFPLYFIFYFLYYFKAYIVDIRNLNYFLIIFVFLVEGLVLDFLHYQMLWVIFALFNVNLYLNLKKIKFNSNHS